MWWFLLFLPTFLGAPVPEKFTVSVPVDPLSASVGSSIILPCSFSPAFTESLQVRWHRPEKYKSPVLLYEKQQIQEQSADPQYRGRVSLIGELEKGNVSLKLDKITVEDYGEFICFIAGTKWYEQGSVQLLVKAVGNPPVLSVTDGGSGQVNVTCKSDGWHPQPTFTWTNKEGSELQYQGNYSAKDAHGFVSVTSWLLHSSSDSEWISCSIGLTEGERKEGRILPYIAGDQGELQRKLKDKEAEIESLKQNNEAQKGNLTAIGKEVERLKKETTTTGPWKEILIVFLVLLLLACIVVCLLHMKGFLKSGAKEALPETQLDKSQANEEEKEKLLKSEEDLKRKNTDLQTEVAERERELETLKGQIEAFEHERNTHQKENQKLNQQNEEVQGELDKTKGELDSLKKQTIELQSQLNESTEEQEKLKQQIKGFLKCGAKEALTETQQDKSQASEEEKQKLQSQLNESTEEQEKLKQQIKDASTQKHIVTLHTWDAVKAFKECPTMDGASVQGDLRIKRDGKVINCPKPENNEILDTSCYVLCKDTFSSGQHCWEVKLSDKSQSEKLSWFVGVCSDKLRGQKEVSLASQNDCWLLCYNKGEGLFVNTNPATPVQIASPLNRLGVFLDCSGHSLTFYNAESQSCLCTFTDMNTTQPLVPVLSPGVRDTGTISLVA